MSFRRYPAYRETGVQWIGAVPLGWQVQPVWKLATLINGHPFDSELFGSDEGFPLVRIRDLNRTNTEANFTGTFVKSAAITKNDVLIGMDGDFNVGRWMGEGEALLNQRMCCLRGDTTHIRFLEYALSYPLRLINDVTYSTTVKHLSSGQVRNIKVPVPPIGPELACVVAFLDRETAKIDALVAEQERLVGLLQEKRQAVIAQAVTKGLDPNVRMRNSGVEWLGWIPEHWGAERARRLFKERDQRSETGEEDLLTVSHLTGVTLRSEKNVYMFEAESMEGYKICEPGDLVINTLWAWMGAMGVCPVHGIVSPAYNVYTPGPGFEPAYVNGLVRIPLFAQEAARYSKGVWSSRLRLYPEGLFQITMPVPPLEEQRAIVSHIARETQKLEALLSEAERTVELLKERRSALISAAVTGKIDVRRLAPAVQEAA